MGKERQNNSYEKHGGGGAKGVCTIARLLFMGAFWIYTLIDAFSNLFVVLKRHDEMTRFPVQI